MEKSKNKVGNVLKSVKEHWKNPPEGRYIPYKEILSYSIAVSESNLYCTRSRISDFRRQAFLPELR